MDAPQTIKPPLPLLAAIAALPPLAVDMYLPAIPAIASDLQSPIATIQNSLSIFLVGFGLGMLLFGPLSDRYGRRPVAIIGLLGFTLASAALGMSETANGFLLWRLLQGVLGSAASVVVPGMIRDCYGKDTAKGMSTVFMMMLVAPLVAPMFGSLLLGLRPWEGIFLVLAAYTLVMLGLTLWRLPETRPLSHVDTQVGLLTSVFRNYRSILGNRSIHLDLLSFMLIALGFFTYVTVISFVYITYYGVSETLFGLLFAMAASGLILANFINARIVSRFGPRRMLLSGLASAIGFALLLTTAVLAEWPLYAVVLCFTMILGSLGIASVNADSLVLIAYPKQASSAAAVTGTLRFGSGALAGPILAATYTGTPLPAALLILCALLLAGACQWLRHRRLQQD